MTHYKQLLLSVFRVLLSNFVRTYSVIVLNCFEIVSTYLETDKIQPLKQIDSRIKLTARAVYVTARAVRFCRREDLKNGTDVYHSFEIN